MYFFIRIGYPAWNLWPSYPFAHKRERHRSFVPLLNFEFVKVHCCRIQSGRCAGLQPSQFQADLLETFRKFIGSWLTETSPGELLSSYVY